MNVVAIVRTALLFGVLSFVAAGSAAQDLTPRSYWPAPEGTRVFTVGYAYSTGDVLTDPSLPVYGVDSTINTGIVGYLQTVNLWGRTSNLIVELPYVSGTTTGTVEEDLKRRELDGFGDLGITLSVNLLGAPTMTPADFMELRKSPHPILGASVKLLAPIGHYDEDKVLNVGANRWAAKIEFGYIVPIKPSWLMEFEVGSWFFGDNDDFVGATREQNPVFAAEVHLVRRIKPGFWVSVEANYFKGGRSIVDGEESDDLQRNSRIGGTIVIPFKGRHAVKIGLSTGIVTQIGSDSKMFLVSYQRVLR